MKKSKKFLCLLLALVMAGSLLLLPAAAANTQQSGAERYPTVYVHGLMGWGARDQIYAVIRGVGVNNDGAGKVGYTAPSVDGQAAAIASIPRAVARRFSPRQRSDGGL